MPLYLKGICATLLFALGLTPLLLSAQVAGIVVEDIFGRDLKDHGLTLVDWDGYLANPAIKFFVLPPSDAAFPGSAVLSANNQRLYFDLPSTVGANGPTKQISFPAANSQVAVYISAAPDRDSLDDDFQLTITFTGADNHTTSTIIPIHEIDQDQPSPQSLQIVTDFTQDQTGFFASTSTRNVISQGALDWAFFFDDMKLDPTPAGQETTFIWNSDGFVSGHFIQNAYTYTGYLLYTYGIHSNALRSGGEVSTAGGLQTSSGMQLSLKRSGGLEIETAGNFNQLGWNLSTVDSDWWLSGNLGNEQNELFSISHHETGHAIAFNPGQSRWATFKSQGCVNDAAVIAYHGACPKIDASDHLSGEIDNASLKGAFGNEYSGNVPTRRWFITKLDLLVAQAIGYKLRPTSAFAPVNIANANLPPGFTGKSYSNGATAQGGIPFYRWTVVSGSLPAGLQLDSFTGKIFGVPITVGTSNFTLQLQDYGGSVVTSQVTMAIVKKRPGQVTSQ